MGGRWEAAGEAALPSAPVVTLPHGETGYFDPARPDAVAFAFAVPNGRTTQIFFNLRDNSATHDKEPFTPFGRVTEGLELIDNVNVEYGEGPGGIRAGKQDPYFEGGNAWLLQQFPKLDYIRSARVLR